MRFRKSVLLVLTLALITVGFTGYSQYFLGTAYDDGLRGGGTVFNLKADGTVLPNAASFESLDFNGYDYRSMILGSDGNLYGTAHTGGAFSKGVIFRIKTDGTGFTKLFDFSGINGELPTGNLVEGANGYLFGVTEEGGATKSGVVFKIKMDGTNFTKLLDFGAALGVGVDPIGLTKGANNVLYGFTYYSPSYNGSGTLFSINADGTGYTLLYNFGCCSLIPMTPTSLIFASDGLLYGTTSDGGTYNQGTLFSIKPNGTSFTKLYDFHGANGSYPSGGLLEGSGGVLFGATSQGGANSSGIIFSINKNGTGIKKIHDFPLLNANEQARASLMLGSNGLIYGAAGGVQPDFLGVIFSFNQDGSNFNSFTITNSSTYNQPVLPVQGPNGLVYGIVDSETLFKVNQDGSGVTTLFKFDTYSPKGAYPNSNVILASDGNLYGTTASGGSKAGAAFQIKPDGTLTKIYDFNSSGYYPHTPLFQPVNSNLLIGTTYYGGANDFGVLFSLTPNGTYTKLQDFTSSTGYAESRLIQASNGNLYGVTDRGIYKTNSDGTGYANIFNFSIFTTGASPLAGLMQGADGKLYGTTTVSGSYDKFGTVYKINLDGTGFTKLYEFTSYAVGSAPQAELVQDSNGTLYGTTNEGGAHQVGIIFSIKPDGTSFTKLYDFDVTTGSNPKGLVIASDGKIYGIASAGGANAGGVVYRINTDGSGFSKIMDLSGTTTGTSPKGALLETSPNSQTISFSTIANLPVTSSPISLSASASSSLPVTFSSAATNITINGNQVTLLQPGKVTISASQIGSWAFATATAQQTFCINPAKPLITASSGTLTSSSNSGNQWYFNNNLISGGNGTTYSPSQLGTYTVQIVTADGCSSAYSDGYIVTTVSAPAPVAAAASLITQTSFTANWNSVAGATGYQLDVSTDNFATFLTGYNSKSETGTSQIVTGLLAGASYQYRVRATTSSGTSANSNVISVSTLPSSVTAPVATAAASISQTSFTANWNSVAGATGYQLDVSTDNFATFLTGYNSKSETGTSQIVTGLTAGTSYQCRVRAITSSGTSANSNVISASTLPSSVTAPVATAAASINQSGFTANWNIVAGATGYQLDISTDNFATFLTGYNSKTETGTTQIVTGLFAGTSYQYRVRATTSLGTSSNSNVISVSTLSSPVPAPVATAATSISSTGFIANWNSVSGATGYRLDISTDNFSTFLTGYNSKIETGTFQVVTGLTSNTSYQYRVRATTSLGTSSNSNVVSVSTLPSPIAPPVAIAASNISSTSFTANWNSVAGATSYQLDISSDNFSTFLTGYNSKIETGTTQVVSGLTLGATYQYRVKAINALVNSTNSNVITVVTSTKSSQTITFNPITDVAIGDPAITLTASASSGLAVTLVSKITPAALTGKSFKIVLAGRDTITASQAGNVTYSAAVPVIQTFCINPAKPVVTMTNNNNGTVTLTSSSKAGNQWYLNGVAINGAVGQTLDVVKDPSEYTVRVKVDDCLSAPGSIKIPTIVTGDITTLPTPLTLYPNPSHDYIFIKGLQEGAATASVIDLIGQHRTIELELQGDNIFKGSINDLANGLYVLQISTDGQVQQIKFIKQ